MAWAYVSSAKAGSAGETTLAKSVTAGNLLVFLVFNQNGTDHPTISDGVNTWTQTTNSPLEDTTNGGGISCFSAVAASTASVTVTVSNFTNTDFGGLSFNEYSGNAASSVNDGTAAGGTANVTGVTSTNGMANGSITTATDGDLIVSAILDLGGSPTVAEYTAGTSPQTFTKRTTGSQDPGGASAATFAVQDCVQTTHGAINPTWTQNTTHKAVLYSASFKVATGGASRGLFLNSLMTGTGTGGSFFRSPE